MKDIPSVKEYPNLFQETVWPWGPIRASFELLHSAPPNDLVGKVNIVPYVGGKVLVIRMKDGHWDIPGGTLEPGETYLEAIRRELLEEAGARLVTFESFGAWNCHSLQSEPYRPHFPHPHFYRLVGYGDVELVSAPLNPVDGEQVIDVELVSLEEASRRFLSDGRPALAELYRLASWVREGSNLG